IGRPLFSRPVPQDVQYGVGRRQGHERLSKADLVGQELDLGPRLGRPEEHRQDLVHRAMLTTGIFTGHALPVASEVNSTVEARDHGAAVSLRGTVGVSVGGVAGTASFRTRFSHWVATAGGSEAAT